MIAFPDMRVVMDEVLARGDRAEYDWTLIGTNPGAGRHWTAVASSFGRLERMDS